MFPVGADVASVTESLRERALRAPSPKRLEELGGGAGITIPALTFGRGHPQILPDLDRVNQDRGRECSNPRNIGVACAPDSAHCFRVTTFNVLLRARPPFSRPVSCLGLLGCFLAALTGCAGGQSGNEGERPAPPCAGSGLLFEAEILTLDDGCVTLRFERKVTGGSDLSDGAGTLLLSGETDAGDSATARLGTTYAFTHAFHAGEAVVALPRLWGDELEFQLMPLMDDEVDVQWGSKRMRATVDDLAAADCAERLDALVAQPRPSSGSVPQTPTSHQTAPQRPLTCSSGADD